MKNPADQKIIKSFWDKIEPEKLEKWMEAQKIFAQEEWGVNLERIDVHLDEKTPHCHCLVNNAIKSVKKYKNQKGEFFKETYSLSAERFNPLYCSQLQDRYALKNSIFGLKRGVQKDKKHKKLKDFYEEQAMETMELIEGYKKSKKFEDVFPILKKTILDSFNAINQLMGILEKKELTEEEFILIEGVSKILPKKEETKKKTI